jgi:hypothetical protein
MERIFSVLKAKESIVRLKLTSHPIETLAITHRSAKSGNRMKGHVWFVDRAWETMSVAKTSTAAIVLKIDFPIASMTLLLESWNAISN